MNGLLTALLVTAGPVNMPPSAPPPNPYVQPTWAQGLCPDPWEFGYTATETRRNYTDASRYYRWGTDNFAPCQARIDWAQDADWCRACWDALDNLLNVPNFMSPEMNSKECTRLLKLLGPDMYYSRIMPPPCAGWHMGGLIPPGVVPPTQR